MRGGQGVAQFVQDASMGSGVANFMAFASYGHVRIASTARADHRASGSRRLGFNLPQRPIRRKASFFLQRRHTRPQMVWEFLKCPMSFKRVNILWALRVAG